MQLPANNTPIQQPTDHIFQCIIYRHYHNDKPGANTPSSQQSNHTNKSSTITTNQQTMEQEPPNAHHNIKILTITNTTKAITTINYHNYQETLLYTIQLSFFLVFFHI